jgi:predicted ester cyclase
MDVKKLAQMSVDTFNDRSFREKAKDLMDANVVVIDGPTGQELHGPDGYVQYDDGFVSAMPDLKGTVIEHKVNGNKVTTRVRGQGTFTGTMVTPQGSMPGNGNPLDIEYEIEQDFNDAGKATRFAVNFDMQDFMRQLGMG